MGHQPLVPHRHAMHPAPVSSLRLKRDNRSMDQPRRAEIPPFALLRAKSRSGNRSLDNNRLVNSPAASLWEIPPVVLDQQR